MEDQLDEFVSKINHYLTNLSRKSPHPMVELANEIGLTPPQAAFLVFLQDADASSVSELSKQWNISQSVATRMIDRLVKKGMISRERDPDDRRIVHAVLTDKGKEFSRKVCTERDKLIKGITSILDENERLVVLELLKKIDEGFE